MYWEDKKESHRGTWQKAFHISWLTGVGVRLRRMKLFTHPCCIRSLCTRTKETQRRRQKTISTWNILLNSHIDPLIVSGSHTGLICLSIISNQYWMALHCVETDTTSRKPELKLKQQQQRKQEQKQKPSKQSHQWPHIPEEMNHTAKSR